MKCLLFSPRMLAELNERGNLLARLNRVQIVQVKWPVWPLLVEKEFKSESVRDRFPRFAFLSADGNLRRRIYQDAVQSGTSWTSNAGMSFSELAAGHFVEAGVECVALIGAERLSPADLETWLQVVEISSIKERPLCLFFFISTNAKAFGAQRLRSCRFLSATPMDFTHATEADVAELLEENDSPVWNSIRDRSLRRELCKSIHVAAGGQMSKIIDLILHSQTDAAVLFEESKMNRFVETFCGS